MHKYSKHSIAIFGFIQIASLGVIDYLTGIEISFSFFYVIPVAMLAWYSDKKTALSSAFASAFVWQLVNRETGQEFSSELIFIWNTITRLGFFLIITLLLIKLKNSFQDNKQLTYIDYLTSAASPRCFYERTKIEIERAGRNKHSITICYFDIDNFKQVNDSLGHSVGNSLLIRVVQVIKQNIRLTDVIARIGGDEFVILLPETNQEQACTTIHKIREKLQAEMAGENWEMTFSMGVLTYIKPPETVDEMIEAADSLMYKAKKTGKNSVKFQVLDGKTIISSTDEKRNPV